MGKEKSRRQHERGRITFQGGGSPLTQLTGRDVQQRSSPYQKLMGGVQQKPQPGKMAPAAWSAPGGAPAALAAPIGPMEELTRAFRGAQKDPAKVADLIKVLLRTSGPHAQKHIFPLIEQLMGQTAKRAEIEATGKGRLAVVGATGEQERLTATHEAGLPMTEKERGELGVKERGAATGERRAELYGERTGTYAKSVEEAAKRGEQLNNYRNKLLAVQRTKLRTAQQNKRTERDIKDLESLDARIQGLRERLGKLEDAPALEAPLEDPELGKKLANLNSAQQAVLTGAIGKLEKKRGTLDHKLRNTLGDGPAVEPEAEAAPEEAAEEPDIFAGPEWQPTERAEGVAAPTMEELTPEQPATQPAAGAEPTPGQPVPGRRPATGYQSKRFTTHYRTSLGEPEAPAQLKPLTANIIAEAKRLHGDDEEAAAMWLASQGYKLE